MTAADVRMSVDFTIETVLNKLDGLYSLKLLLRKYMLFFVAQCCVTRIAAVIGCRPIQLRPEAFWSAPVGDGNQK